MPGSTGIDDSYNASTRRGTGHVSQLEYERRQLTLAA